MSLLRLSSTNNTGFFITKSSSIFFSHIHTSRSSNSSSSTSSPSTSSSTSSINSNAANVVDATAITTEALQDIQNKVKINNNYRTSTPPSGVPLSKIFSNNFPLSFKESFNHYKIRNDLAKIEYDLLSTLEFFPEPSEYYKSEIKNTVIDDKTGDFINEFNIEPLNFQDLKEEDKHYLIFIHGYGAGQCFFYKNLEKIANLKIFKNWKIISIDLLGYGNSSRPNFPHYIPFKDYEKVEDIFVESLNTWFTKNNFPANKTLVVSHSMGSYLSILLNIKYPDLFKKLIMVSPGGISIPRIKPKIPLWFEKLWNLNVSPFSLVRYSGPFGSYFVSGWTSRRFSKNKEIFSKLDQSLLHLYTYSIFNAKGSGEYMLNYFLAPGGVPKNPLINRMSKFKCDTLWCYGSNDWMDKKGGLKCSNDLKSRGFISDYIEIEDSGHHIYLDNFNKFNELIVSEMNRFETTYK
ncbi:hypothetical protein B5S33_g4203 [[Candida] boidinii]|nr:hypothetical protein B5S33_g4203 [[Candida] boidinii]